MKGPLESTKYFILLALAASPMMGTDIRRQIIGDTLGIYLSDGTLYAALAVMVRAGLIEKAGGGRTYALTDKGRHRLEVTSRTLKRAVELSQLRLRWR